MGRERVFLLSPHGTFCAILEHFEDPEESDEIQIITPQGKFYAPVRPPVRLKGLVRDDLHSASDSTSSCIFALPQETKKRSISISRKISTAAWDSDSSLLVCFTDASVWSLFSSSLDRFEQGAGDYYFQWTKDPIHTLEGGSQFDGNLFVCQIGIAPRLRKPLGSIPPFSYVDTNFALWWHDGKKVHELHSSQAVPITHIAASPSGKLVAIATEKYMRIYSTRKRKKVYSLKWRNKSLMARLFSPLSLLHMVDDSHLALGTLDGEVALWNTKSCETPKFMYSGSMRSFLTRNEAPCDLPSPSSNFLVVANGRYCMVAKLGEEAQILDLVLQKVESGPSLPDSLFGLNDKVHSEKPFLQCNKISLLKDQSGMYWNPKFHSIESFSWGILQETNSTNLLTVSETPSNKLSDVASFASTGLHISNVFTDTVEYKDIKEDLSQLLREESGESMSLECLSATAPEPMDISSVKRLFSLIHLNRGQLFREQNLRALSLFESIRVARASTRIATISWVHFIRSVLWLRALLHARPVMSSHHSTKILERTSAVLSLSKQVTCASIASSLRRSQGLLDIFGVTRPNSVSYEDIACSSFIKKAITMSNDASNNSRKAVMSETTFHSSPISAMKRRRRKS